jgi:NAD/NADP transhydrogenase beta subunit
MVAFQHGAGGVAAFLVSLVELTRSTHALDTVSEISGVLGLTIGALTFSASMVASAKLANRIRQTPQILPGTQFTHVDGILAACLLLAYHPFISKPIWFGFSILPRSCCPFFSVSCFQFASVAPICRY